MSVHLHVRSAYTLLQSTLTIPKIIACTKQHGYQSVALTDKNVMHGAMAFYHACIKENIKPIFGMEVEAAYDNDSLGFILLAKKPITIHRIPLHIAIDFCSNLDLV